MACSSPCSKVARSVPAAVQIGRTTPSHAARGAFSRRSRRPEARPLVDLSDLHPAELSDLGPALTPSAIRAAAVSAATSRTLTRVTPGAKAHRGAAKAPSLGERPKCLNASRTRELRADSLHGDTSAQSSRRRQAFRVSP